MDEAKAYIELVAVESWLQKNVTEPELRLILAKTCAKIKDQITGMFKKEGDEQWTKKQKT